MLIDPLILDARDNLFQLNKQRLQELAHRAINIKGLKPTDFVIVCIDVDDPTWTELADNLMPGANWQSVRDTGAKPIARGSAMSGIVEPLTIMVPDLKESLLMALPPGYVRALIMSDSGLSVYFIEPIPEVDNAK